MSYSSSALRSVIYWLQNIQNYINKEVNWHYPPTLGIKYKEVSKFCQTFTRFILCEFCSWAITVEDGLQQQKNKNMMSQGPVNHLKNRYVGLVTKSPIFFTAPHSKRLNRGGQLYKERHRIHKRQIYTSFITCDLAKNTSKQSFLFWGTSNLISDQDIDPNYMMKQQFSDSPFHQALQCWAMLNQEQPILHVDIHGKMDRESNCQIDVGMLSMEVHWKGDPLIDRLKDFFKKEGKIFDGYTFKGFKCKFNTEPDLHGYWGSKVYTMTEQAILLGIPSFQFEIPFSVRKKMLRDGQLRARMHNFIRKMYSEVIVPDFKQKNRALKIAPEIGKLYVHTPTIKGEKEREEVYQQVLRYQTKEEANPNQSKNI